jgi:cytochrome P450
MLIHEVVADTVTSSLGFQFLHLARNAEQQAQLRANPEMIPQAVAELLRFYSIVNPTSPPPYRQGATSINIY